MKKETITMAHFTFNGGEGLSFPGVERVIHTHAVELTEREYSVRVLVGETDVSREGFPYAIIVEPNLKSRAYPLLGEGGFIDEENILEVLKILERTIEGPFIAHNTTNSARHNPPFGAAVARYVEQNGVEGKIIWVHDARKLYPPHAGLFLPNLSGAKLAVVSGVRRQQLEEIISKARERGINLPEFDIRVIPNPIDPQFFNPNTPVPSSLLDLAPNISDLQDIEPSNISQIEQLLFSNEEDVFTVVVPARIVGQKRIIESLEIFRKYSEQNNQRVLLVITGKPDFRKPENEKYYKRVVGKIREIRESGNNRLLPVILNGANWEYMPWLYRRANLVLCYFKDEGFGIPPVEAAVSGAKAIVVSDDPALLETTGGNALSLRSDISFEEAVDEIKHYLNSNLPGEHVKALREIAEERYTVEAVVNELLSFLSS